MWCFVTIISLFSYCAIGVLASDASVEKISLRMPDVTTSSPDTYVCTHIRLKETKYLIGFDPIGDVHIVHHMILFKCSSARFDRASYPCSYPCAGSKIVYVWAHSAPSLNLPNDVAFEAGPSTGFPYLVLQVHYLKRISKKDRSGVIIRSVKKPQPRVAGVMLMMSDGIADIPAHAHDVRFFFGCKYTAKTAIAPFAFRTHAHTLGRTIFAYQFPDGQKEGATLIGRGSPQWPQAFYNTFSTEIIKRGDVLVGACVYDSMHRDRVTEFGATHNDEMCNFYMMYSQAREDPPLTADQTEVCERGVRIRRKTFDRLMKLVPEEVLKYLPTTRELKATKGDPQATKNVSAAIHGGFQAVEWLLRYQKRLGQVSGVSIDSRGRLYIFHRGDRVWNASAFDGSDRLTQAYRRTPIKASTVLVVDRASGGVVAHFGANTFYMPHGIHVDPNDDVWVTDVGLHQVMKFKQSAWEKPVLTLGVAFEPGSDAGHFCKPTDVATFRSGEVFVADGYCNSRVLKFSRTGQLLGVLRSQDGSFIIPHSLARVNGSRLCVADRERARVECFSAATGQSLALLKDVPAFGSAVYAVASSADGDLLHGVTTRSDDGPKGFTYSWRSRSVVSRWGKSLRGPHDLATVGDSLYVAEIREPYRVQAFRRPQARKSVENDEDEDEDITTRGGNAQAMHAMRPAKNGTVVESRGFLELLSANSPMLIGVVIVLPLAIIVVGAVTVHLHKNGMCACLCRSCARARSDKERGRFEPLLNDESDSDDTDDVLNIAAMKRRVDRRA